MMIYEGIGSEKVWEELTFSTTSTRLFFETIFLTMKKTPQVRFQNGHVPAASTSWISCRREIQFFWIGELQRTSQVGFLLSTRLYIHLYFY